MGKDTSKEAPRTPFAAPSPPPPGPLAPAKPPPVKGTVVKIDQVLTGGDTVAVRARVGDQSYRVKFSAVDLGTLPEVEQKRLYIARQVKSVADTEKAAAAAAAEDAKRDADAAKAAGAEPPSPAETVVAPGGATTTMPGDELLGEVIVPDPVGA